MDAYHHELRIADQAARERSERRAAAIRCDGSGWIGDDPCRACNPALLKVWNDPDMKRLWRNGRPLHRILGYDTRDELDTELRRPRCLPDDRTEWVDQRDGMAIAVAAYRAEYDREPPKGLRAMIAAATRPRQGDS